MNPGNILCWNVRGLNSRARQDSVRTLVSSAKIDSLFARNKNVSAISRYHAFYAWL
jgi:hypothetical protein